MLRKLFSFSGMLLLVGAAIIATPGSVRAQRGGGHGGGGHIGGGHISGGNFGGARVGGSNRSVFRGGYHDGYRNYYRPYYGTYGYYYPSYSSYPYVWSSPTYDSGYSGSYGDVAPSYPGGYAPSAGTYQSFYPPATAQPDTSVSITVNVPTAARVWFDGTPTTSTGPVREFHSPPVTPGSGYTYAIRASWNENGQEVTQTQQVRVTPGAHVNVNFPVPAKPTGSAVR